ncbi:MAG: hypothetical protein CMB80_02720 [Flammeovirgaceae bacterium]|nr:hypothetical protein [Flammeovirgaceae bacterium]|tara:strand:- start:1002 stop:1919 length:918 start_codon:yes stop_codon:yes gene_type:complete
MARQNRSGFQSSWLGGSLQIFPPDVAGDAYFVDATNGASTNNGSSWSDAMATCDQAIDKCTANQGDTIFIAPWHTESEATAATSITTMDTAGVSLIGLTQGNQRPTFTFTANDAYFSVTAANCRVSGIKIISDVADMASGLTLGASADGAEIDNCIFTDGSAAKELVIGISVTAACDGCKIHDNQFYTVDGGGCASAIKLVGESARTVIANNYIFGDYSAACIDGTTAAQTIIIISDNVMRNVDTTAGSVIELHNSSTGLITRNLGQAGKAITDTITAAACMVCENYMSGAVSASGILDPAADAD